MEPRRGPRSNDADGAGEAPDGSWIAFRFPRGLNMLDTFIDLNGIRVYRVPTEGPELRNGQDAVDLISAAAEQRAALIAIPVERLGDDFFELRTRIAGDIAQKFSMYGMRVAIVGDIRQRIAASKSLAAFVRESNSGYDLWFVDDLQELAIRIAHWRGVDQAGLAE
jgi:uncharacterized protein DUF4180